MMNEELLPGTLVRITAPDPDHKSYLNAVGRILDVRDFGDRRFCQVGLDDDQVALIWLESTELTVE